MLVRELRPNQERCFEQAKKAYEKNPKTNFLVAAKCRFGKTFTALKIAFDAWNAKDLVLVISGFKSVQEEWEAEYRNFFADRKADFEFHTVQGLNIDKEFNSIHGLKDRGIVLIFDEAHFAERTLRTKEIVDYLKPDNILYLTATPYTNSLVSQFGEDFEYDFSESTIFKYSIQQEIEEYTKVQDFKEKYKYTPVRLGLVGIEKAVGLWKQANGDEIWQLEAIENFKKELESRNCRTFIYFTASSKQCKSVYEAFKSAGVSGANISGKEEDARNVEKVKKLCKEAKDKNEFFGIFSCKRGGTGVTWEGLDAVVFYNAPNSAIDFIQKSYRCANPCDEPLKKKAYVFCLNKESALNAYLQINANEAKLRNISAKENFKSFQNTITLEGEFSEKNFEELETEIAKNFRYQLFEVPTGVQLKSFILSDTTETSSASVEATKDVATAKNQKENTKKSIEDAADVESVAQEENESEQEKQRKAIFEKYVALLEVVDYVLTNHPELQAKKIGIRSIDKYPWWLQQQIEINFTLEDWLKLLNGEIFGAERARQYIQEKKEKEELRNSTVENKEMEMQELKNMFPDCVKEEETSTRNKDLQAALKKHLKLVQKELFSGQNIEYCHIVPFEVARKLNYEKAIYDWENAFLLPKSLHTAWDDGLIEFEVQADNRIKFLLTGQGKKDISWKDNDACNKAISNCFITEAQKKYLQERKELKA